VISPNGVWRVLRRHGLNRRISRLSLVSGYAAPPEPERPTPLEARHVEVTRPGELVGFDCFHVGRLAGTTGRVWQYTAIELASSYVWAELATTPLNPSAARTSALARRVAADLRAHGWRLERALSDNGSEFRSQVFGDTVRELKATQTFVRAGRPATNGAVERVPRTILEECWRPSFARSLVPKLTKLTGLTRDLAAYLRFYNEERARTGRLTQGKTPLEALIGARKDEATMTEMCRYISEAVQSSPSADRERARRLTRAERCSRHSATPLGRPSKGAYEPVGGLGESIG
jgi:transposase InsO family protein